MDSPGGAGGKEPTCQWGDIRDAGSIPGSGRSPTVENGNPLQYSCLENPKDRGVWQATVHRVAKSRTQLKQLSTGVCYIKYPMINHNGKEYYKSVYICITDSLCCIAEINTVNQLYFNLKKSGKELPNILKFFLGETSNTVSYMYQLRWQWRTCTFLAYIFQSLVTQSVGHRPVPPASLGAA